MFKKTNHNAVKEIRETLLMSKAELARKAGLSPMTIDSVENGMSCRMDTKRKIILALGYDLSDRNKIFPMIKEGEICQQGTLGKDLGLLL